LERPLAHGKRRGSEPFSRYGDARRRWQGLILDQDFNELVARRPIGLPDATAKILSAKSVLLLGVAGWRLPRRSPVFEPLGMLLVQVANAPSPKLSAAGPGANILNFMDGSLIHCYRVLLVC